MTLSDKRTFGFIRFVWSGNQVKLLLIPEGIYLFYRSVSVLHPLIFKSDNITKFALSLPIICPIGPVFEVSMIRGQGSRLCKDMDFVFVQKYMKTHIGSQEISGMQTSGVAETKKGTK